MKFARRGRFRYAGLARPAARHHRRKASAQGQRRTPTPNDTLMSTEFAHDHKVTFRIYAPKATEVSVLGEFGGGKMSKDEKGVWSTTVGPLTPDYLFLSIHRGRRPDDRPQERDDQARDEQHR